MFALKVATVLAVAAFVSAIPTPGGGSSCSTGKQQCCDSIAPNNGTDNSDLAGLIPVNLQDLGIPIGLNCIPISALIGLGSAGTCSSQAACCNGVSNAGLIPIGINCSPINVGA